MSSRECPDCLNPIKVCRALGGCGRGERIEAHGVKGLSSTPWIKTFADRFALAAWAQKNSADVYGTREPSGGRPITMDLVEAKTAWRAKVAGIERRKAARKDRLQAEQVSSCYGTAQPQIKLTGGRDEHFRAVSAELHQLAAAVELATMKTADRWVVRIEHDHDVIGRVVLELIEGDAAEAERGLALLTKIVRDAHLAQAKAVPS